MRGWWAALGSVTTGNLGSRKPAGIWLVKVPGVKQPAIGVVAVAAANFSTVCGLVFLEDMTPTLAGFNGQQRHELSAELLPGSLQICNIDALIFSFCRCTVPFGSQGWCHLNEFLLYLQDIKGSRHCENFPLSYNRNPEQHHMDLSLNSLERPENLIETEWKHFYERLSCCGPQL